MTTIAEPHARGHSLKLDAIDHRFGDFVAASDITLDMAAGELVALLGPSGCGKSTLLRIISGFLVQTRGRVLFDNQPVDHLPPNRRGVGIVFQNYALFPHMTVAQNVAYGLEARRSPRELISSRVAEMLALVQMKSFADRLPRQLSGGQQQRIALARALAVDPKILLLDEPFGALDKNLRLDMQIEVKRLQREYGITTVMVTHDQEEALSMADRIAVMNAGRIEQLSAPTDLYDHPATLFVNNFVGSSNLLPGTLTAADVVQLADGTMVACARAAALATGTKVLWSVRPERLRIETSATSGAVPVTIKLMLPLGPMVVYEAETADGTALKINVTRDAGASFLQPGERVYAVPAAPAFCHVFVPS